MCQGRSDTPRLHFTTEPQPGGALLHTVKAQHPLKQWGRGHYGDRASRRHTDHMGCLVSHQGWEARAQ